MDRTRGDLRDHRHASGADWTFGLLMATAMLGIVAAGADETPRDPAAHRVFQPYRPYASLDHGLAHSKQVFDERRARYQGLPATKASVNLALEDVTTED